MAAHCTDSGQLLLGAEPFLHLQSALVGHVHIQSQMLEAALQGASGAGYRHHTGLDGGFDILRDLDTLVRVDRSHFDDTAKSQTNLVSNQLMHFY